MKKILSVLLALVLVFGLCSTAFAADAEKPFENSEFYSVGEYSVHYRVYEPGFIALKQIMLIHGFCLSTVTFEGIAQEYVKKGYRVVLVDVPNFGYSSRENNSTKLMSREEVIGSLMENLGGKWIVGGHSMGGGIALNLATDYPQTVTGLILFAPQTSARAEGSMSQMGFSPLVQLMYKFVLKLCLSFPLLVKLFVSTSFSDAEYAASYDISRITDPFRLPGSAVGVSVMTTHTRDTDFDKVKSLDIPCVIITAVNDKVANADNLQTIIDNAPEDTEVYEFSEGGHMMMEYSPVEVAEKTFTTIEKARLF